jgi:hypothetical protein
MAFLCWVVSGPTKLVQMHDRSTAALARAQLYAGDVGTGQATERGAVAHARALGDDGMTAPSLLVLLEIPAAPHETAARLADALEVSLRRPHSC